MKKNTALTQLDLYCEKQRRKKQNENKKITIHKCKDNNIGVEGTRRLSESLMINATLTELDLKCEEQIRKEGNKIMKGRQGPMKIEQTTTSEWKEQR